MGCTLRDFTPLGDWQRTVLPDGRILETQPAKTTYLGTLGVLYRIDGSFQGFVGTEEAAYFWAMKKTTTGGKAK